jgi:hypothetical protein
MDLQVTACLDVDDTTLNVVPVSSPCGSFLPDSKNRKTDTGIHHDSEMKEAEVSYKSKKAALLGVQFRAGSVSIAFALID